MTSKLPKGSDYTVYVPEGGAVGKSARTWGRLGERLRDASDKVIGVDFSNVKIDSIRKPGQLMHQDSGTNVKRSPDGAVTVKFRGREYQLDRPKHTLLGDLSSKPGNKGVKTMKVAFYNPSPAKTAVGGPAPNRFLSPAEILELVLNGRRSPSYDSSVKIAAGSRRVKAKIEGRVKK